MEVKTISQFKKKKYFAIKKKSFRNFFYLLFFENSFRIF